MEITITVYLAINLIMVGAYLLNGLNGHKKVTKILISVLLFFFGAILILGELIFGNMINKFRDRNG